MLEDYEKAEITNSKYLEKTMDVIFETEEAKKISDSSGREIVQLSDGNNIVNIYKKGLAYGINLNGTNFSLIVSENDGTYIFKNPKLDIEHRLNEIILNEKSAKRNMISKIKDYVSKSSYLDCNGNLTLLYSEGLDTNGEKYVIYNEKLAGLDYLDLKKYADNELNNVKQEKNEKELPKNIEDFDFSEYEEKSRDNGANDNIEDIDKDGNIEIDLDEEFNEFIDGINKKYNDYVCKRNNEIIMDQYERLMLLQGIDGLTRTDDENFFEISETVNEIIERYQAAINFLEKDNDKSEIKDGNKNNDNDKEIKNKIEKDNDTKKIEIINKSKEFLSKNLQDENNVKLESDKSEDQER